MKLQVPTFSLIYQYSLFSLPWRHRSLLLLFWLILHSSSFSQTKQWDKTYGGTNFDGLSTLIATPDGGLLMGGTSISVASGDKSENSRGDVDYWVIKTDANGNKQWDKTFGGSNSDYLQSIVATPDGGYLLAGDSESGISGDKSEANRGLVYEDYWIVKIDGQGNKQWDRTFGGDNRDTFLKVVSTPDNGFLLGGISKSNKRCDKSQENKGDFDYWVVKVDGNGHKQWDKTFGGSAFDNLRDLVVIPDGGYLLAGSSYSGKGGDKNDAKLGYWVLKIDDNGEKQWDKTYGSNGPSVEQFSTITIAEDGFLLGGSSYSDISGDKSEANRGDCKTYCPTEGECQITCSSDFWVIKIDKEGRKIWDKSLGGTENDFLSAMIATPDGGFLLGGRSFSGTGGDKSEASRGDCNPYCSSDYWIVKLDGEGRKEWDKTLGGNLNDYLSSLIATNDGRFLIGGSSDSPASGDKSQGSKGDSDFWSVKIEEMQPSHQPASLIKHWDKTYGGKEGDTFSAIIPTPDGGYLLGGSSSSDKGEDKSEASRGGTDYWILKVDNNGKKQWDRTIGGNSNDNLRTMVATPDGGYLLGGSSYSGVSGEKSEAHIGGSDGWLVKIDSLGQKQWDKTYGDSILSGFGYRYDIEEAITTMVATADSGFLLGVTSTFRINNSLILKIDKLGNLQRKYKYDYANSDREIISAIIATADGGFLLGGNTYTAYSPADVEAGRGELDFYIVKINNNGNIQWEKTFGGSSYENFHAMVATPDGGYLLGGNSVSGIGGDKSEALRGECNGNFCLPDYWVVKIDASGNKEWDKTLGGTAEDELNDLMVTPDGNYLLGGHSKSGIGFEKSEGNFGANDYWAIKLDGTGKKIWDKAFGGGGADILSSLITTTDEGFLLAGTSNSNVSGVKSEASKGSFDYWLVKVADTTASACTASGSILREQWNGINGIRVKDIPLHSPPTSSSLLNSFEGPSNIGEVYGSRIRGYICAPQTGYYTFWIAGDNEVQLWLSPDANPDNKVQIASHLTWTSPRSWYEHASQQSAPIALVAGQRYYIEALHKEGTREDHLSVAWQLPNGTMEAPIPGSRLSPYEPANTISAMQHTRLENKLGTQDHPDTNLQVYPNPFSSITTLVFTPQEGGKALLELLSLQGNVVKTIYQGNVEANTVSAHELDGNNLANGVYLARLVLNGKTSYQRMVLLK